MVTELNQAADIAGDERRSATLQDMACLALTQRVGSLSFGERARLVLARLVAQGCNFLLLDEPVNHLDIPSRSRFEQAMTLFQGTVLAIVHDRYFIENFATGLWAIEGEKVRAHVDL